MCRMCAVPRLPPRSHPQAHRTPGGVHASGVHHPPSEERMSPERHRTRWAARAVLPALVAALGAAAAPAGAQSPVTAQSDTLVFASTAAAAQPTPRDVFVTNNSGASLPGSAVSFGAPQYPAG